MAAIKKRMPRGVYFPDRKTITLDHPDDEPYITWGQVKRLLDLRARLRNSDSRADRLNIRENVDILNHIRTKKLGKGSHLYFGTLVDPFDPELINSDEEVVEYYDTVIYLGFLDGNRWLDILYQRELNEQDEQ